MLRHACGYALAKKGHPGLLGQALAQSDKPTTAEIIRAIREPTVLSVTKKFPKLEHRCHLIDDGDSGDSSA
jgi:hypothetical protein